MEKWEGGGRGGDFGFCFRSLDTRESETALYIRRVEYNQLPFTLRRG